jgi:hypothetical protein
MSEETGLMISMMACVADESLVLLRFFDTDGYDKSALCSELDSFLKRCTWLIEERGIFTTGYTKYMLETLSTRRTIYLRGKPRFLGGSNALTPELLTKVLVPFVSWLQLCRHTIRAEMPEFETMQAFKCFSFLDCTATAQTAAKLGVLANILNLDGVRLRAEFDDLRPIARCCGADGKSTEQAWQEALHLVRKSAKSRALHPSDEVRKALIRFVAWDGNTTGIERFFAIALCSTATERGFVSEERLDDEALLLKEDTPVVDLALCSEARGVWQRIYASLPRDRHAARVDKGVKRGPTTNSEAAFIKKRRLEVGAAAAAIDSLAAACPVPQVVGENGWEDPGWVDSVVY